MQQILLINSISEFIMVQKKTSKSHNDNYVTDFAFTTTHIAYFIRSEISTLLSSVSKLSMLIIFCLDFLA